MKKRFLATILAMCLLFTGTNVFYAEENNESVTETQNAQLRETLMNKAVQAFPEYESEIRGENISEITFARMRSIGLGEVVYSETRELSESEMVTYTEFDSGIALTAVGLMPSKTIVEELNYGTNTSVLMDVWLLWGNSSSVLYVKNVKYSIYPNSYDILTQKGSIDTPLCTTLGTVRTAQNLFETSSNNAYVEYKGSFVFFRSNGSGEMPYFMEANLRIEVGDNKCTLSAY